MVTLDHPGFGSGPPPMPISNPNLEVPANAVSAQIAKLTMLINGNGVMRSTSIDRQSQYQKAGVDSDPVAKTALSQDWVAENNVTIENGYLYSDDGDCSSEDI
ncbi:hypothetical protein Ddc_12151 [Ditylenchus destructor]|nr:hypothetical protein Ddc_12151 [Ditylenchus destructor]